MKPRVKWIFYAVCAIVGGVLGFVLSVAEIDLPKFFFFALLAGFLAITIHECGHLIAGLLCGFKTHLFVVGPVCLHRVSNGGFRLRFQRTPFAGLYSGVPTDPNGITIDGLRQSMMSIAAGGPIASLLSILVLPFAPRVWAVSPDGGLLIAIFGGLSVLFSLLTLIPSSIGGLVSDGGRLLRLLRREPSADRWCSLVLLGGFATTVRPREWPVTLVEASTAVLDDSPDSVASAVLRHSFHADRMELIEARTCMEAALERVNNWFPAARPIVFCEAAYFEAVHGSVDVARKHLELARKRGLLSKSSFYLAEAAVCAAEGKRDEAFKHAAKAEASIGESSVLPELVREQAAEIRARAGVGKSADAAR